MKRTIFFILSMILFHHMQTINAMQLQKKDATHDSDDFADDSQWSIVYSPRSLERRNQYEELSPRTSSSKNAINIDDYDPISSNCSSEVGESCVDGKIISNTFDQEPIRPPIQVTIIKKQEVEQTSYKSIVLAAVTVAGAAGFALGWFSHYINLK